MTEGRRRQRSVGKFFCFMFCQNISFSLHQNIDRTCRKDVSEKRISLLRTVTIIMQSLPLTNLVKRRHVLITV